MEKDLVTYYKLRAHEYEQVYHKPERQTSLIEAENSLKTIFKGKTVLEIACGTGYWTEKIAELAESVLATDINSEVIDIAKAKNYPRQNVAFEKSDLLQIKVKQPYQSLFGGFIWSHIKKQELEHFLKTLLTYVQPGGTLVFMDNLYVEGSNHPITRVDEQGNTYQQRKLQDGSAHLVLKNFPDEDFLRSILSGHGTDITYTNLNYFWVLSFKSKTPNPSSI